MSTSDSRQQPLRPDFCETEEMPDLMIDGITLPTIPDVFLNCTLPELPEIEIPELDGVEFIPPLIELPLLPVPPPPPNIPPTGGGGGGDQCIPQITVSKEIKDGCDTPADIAIYRTGQCGVHIHHIFYKCGFDDFCCTYIWCDGEWRLMKDDYYAAGSPQYGGDGLVPIQLAIPPFSGGNCDPDPGDLGDCCDPAEGRDQLWWLTSSVRVDDVPPCWLEVGLVISREDGSAAYVYEGCGVAGKDAIIAQPHDTPPVYETGAGAYPYDNLPTRRCATPSCTCDESSTSTSSTPPPTSDWCGQNVPTFDGRYEGEVVIVCECTTTTTTSSTPPPECGCETYTAIVITPQTEEDNPFDLEATSACWKYVGKLAFKRGVEEELLFAWVLFGCLDEGYLPPPVVTADQTVAILEGHDESLTGHVFGYIYHIENANPHSITIVEESGMWQCYAPGGWYMCPPPDQCVCVQSWAVLRADNGIYPIRQDIPCGWYTVGIYRREGWETQEPGTFDYNKTYWVIAGCSVFKPEWVVDAVELIRTDEGVPDAATIVDDTALIVYLPPNTTRLVSLYYIPPNQITDCNCDDCRPCTVSFDMGGFDEHGNIIIGTESYKNLSISIKLPRPYDREVRQQETIEVTIRLPRDPDTAYLMHMSPFVLFGIGWVKHSTTADVFTGPNLAQWIANSSENNLTVKLTLDLIWATFEPDRPHHYSITAGYYLPDDMPDNVVSHTFGPTLCDANDCWEEEILCETCAYTLVNSVGLGVGLEALPKDKLAAGDSLIIPESDLSLVGNVTQTDDEYIPKVGPIFTVGLSITGVNETTTGISPTGRIVPLEHELTAHVYYTAPDMFYSVPHKRVQLIISITGGAVQMTDDLLCQFIIDIIFGRDKVAHHANFMVPCHSPLNKTEITFAVVDITEDPVGIALPPQQLDFMLVECTSPDIDCCEQDCAPCCLFISNVHGAPIAYFNDNFGQYWIRYCLSTIPVLVRILYPSHNRLFCQGDQITLTVTPAGSLGSDVLLCVTTYGSIVLPSVSGVFAFDNSNHVCAEVGAIRAIVDGGGRDITGEINRLEFYFHKPPVEDPWFPDPGWTSGSVVIDFEVCPGSTCCGCEPTCCHDCFFPADERSWEICTTNDTARMDLLLMDQGTRIINYETTIYKDGVLWQTLKQVGDSAHQVSCVQPCFPTSDTRCVQSTCTFAVTVQTINHNTGYPIPDPNLWTLTISYASSAPGCNGIGTWGMSTGGVGYIWWTASLPPGTSLPCGTCGGSSLDDIAVTINGINYVYSTGFTVITVGRTPPGVTANYCLDKLQEP